MADNLPAVLSVTPDSNIRVELPFMVGLLAFLWCVLLLAVVLFFAIIAYDVWASVFLVLLFISMFSIYCLADEACKVAKMRCENLRPLVPSKE